MTKLIDIGMFCILERACGQCLMTKLIDIRMFCFLHFRARMWAMFDDETNRH